LYHYLEPEEGTIADEQLDSHRTHPLFLLHAHVHTPL